MIAVVGATATGKSDLAVALAVALDGEVINADASQLYTGMDVGTAKLNPQDRAGIPHHLLDVLDVRDDASVAAYQRAARAVFDEIALRGAVAVLVGGSGLYVRAALDRLDFPGTDPAVRARLEADVQRSGAAALHERLRALDPAAAAAILATNARRVVRAMEAIEVSGRPFSASMPGWDYALPALQVGLRVPRDVLDARIAARVETMWRNGLVDEVRRLERQGLRQGRTASRALGYAQVLDHLAGDITEAQARDATIRATRRFARRQESWFRRDPRIHWVDAADAAPHELLHEALTVVRGAAP